MVTNLPAEAKAKWIKVMDAKTPEEKMKAIQEFLSAVPKHKGTENLVMWARRRMAELREESELSHRKSGGSGRSFFVEKEGAGQVILLGERGMSEMLMRSITNAKLDSRDLPIPGITYYEDVRIQLVLPPELIIESKLIANRIIGLVRNADSILFLTKGRDDYEKFRDYLKANNILLGRPKGRVDIERTRTGRGIRFAILGKLVNTTEEEIRKFLAEYRINSAMVRVIGEVTLDDVEKALFGSIVYKPAVIATTEDFETEIPKVVMKKRSDIEVLKRLVYESLGVIRVYTKEPNEEPSKEPLILKRGSTVMDVARLIHSQIAENLRYAKVEGRSVKFPQRVGMNHVLEDGDIVELRSKV